MLKSWSERKKATDEEDDDDDPPGRTPGGDGGNEDEMTPEDVSRIAAEAVQKALTAAGITPAAPAGSNEQVVVTDSDALASAISTQLKPTLKGVVAELLPEALQTALAKSPAMKGLAGTLDSLGTHIDEHAEASREHLTQAVKGFVAEVQKGFTTNPVPSPAAPVAPTPAAPAAVPVVPALPLGGQPVPNGSAIGQPVQSVAVNKGFVDGSGNPVNAFELVEKGMSIQQASDKMIPGLSELSIAVSAGEQISPDLIRQVQSGIASAGG